jgi:hypothetical protein
MAKPDGRLPFEVVLTALLVTVSDRTKKQTIRLLARDFPLVTPYLVPGTIAYFFGSTGEAFGNTRNPLTHKGLRCLHSTHHRR